MAGSSRKLSEQGAQAAALDIIFNELRSDHPPVQMADGAPHRK